MSPLQNGNTAPSTRSAGNFYVPSTREGVIPSTHSIGENVSRNDLVSHAANQAMDAANAGESTIPQSVLSQDQEKIVKDFHDNLEHINTVEDFQLYVDMAHRIDHFRKTVPVKV